MVTISEKEGYGSSVVQYTSYDNYVWLHHHHECIGQRHEGLFLWGREEAASSSDELCKKQSGGASDLSRRGQAAGNVTVGSPTLDGGD